MASCDNSGHGNGDDSSTTHTLMDDEEEDDLESAHGGSLLDGPLDDPHNIRKLCRITCAAILITGVVVLAVLIGVNVDSRSKSNAMATSHNDSHGTTSTSDDEIIRSVPKAPDDLSMICSPSHFQFEDGLLACQRACEAAACCMEEDEALNCMSDGDGTNKQNCLEYVICLNVRNYDGQSSTDGPTTHSDEMHDSILEQTTSSPSKASITSQPTVRVTSTPTISPVSLPTALPIAVDWCAMPHTCESCLNLDFCVWSKSKCSKSCPTEEQFGDYSPCYSSEMQDMANETPDRLCQLEIDETQRDDLCNMMYDCEDCLNVELPEGTNGQPMTCRWFVDPNSDDTKGKCQSACSTLHGCGVATCPKITTPADICTTENDTQECIDLCNRRKCCFIDNEQFEDCRFQAESTYAYCDGYEVCKDGDMVVANQEKSVTRPPSAFSTASPSSLLSSSPTTSVSSVPSLLQSSSPTSSASSVPSSSISSSPSSAPSTSTSTSPTDTKVIVTQPDDNESDSMYEPLYPVASVCTKASLLDSVGKSECEKSCEASGSSCCTPQSPNDYDCRKDQVSFCKEYENCALLYLDEEGDDLDLSENCGDEQIHLFANWFKCSIACGFKDDCCQQDGDSSSGIMDMTSCPNGKGTEAYCKDYQICDNPSVKTFDPMGGIDMEEWTTPDNENQDDPNEIPVYTPQQVIKTCHPDHVLTKTDHDECLKMCQTKLCCFLDISDSDNCAGDTEHECLNYHSCRNADKPFQLPNTDPSLVTSNIPEPISNLAEVCQSTLVESDPMADSDCREACTPAFCCKNPAVGSCDHDMCEKYKPCQSVWEGGYDFGMGGGGGGGGADGDGNHFNFNDFLGMGDMGGGEGNHDDLKEIHGDINEYLDQYGFMGNNNGGSTTIEEKCSEDKLSNPLTLIDCHTACIAGACCKYEDGMQCPAVVNCTQYESCP